MTIPNTNEQDIILNLMTRPFESLSMPQSRLCGLFVFIDHLMSKHQKAPCREKQLKIIDTLLQSGPRMHVAIHHPKNEDIQTFLQKMIKSADQIEEDPATHQPLIQKCAKRFKEAFQAFFSLIKNKIAKTQGTLQDLWKQLDTQNEIRLFASTFVNSLVNFTYLFYQETIGRLLKLNPIQVEGRLHHAQCLCAKAIM